MSAKNLARIFRASLCGPSLARDTMKPSSAVGWNDTNTFRQRQLLVSSIKPLVCSKLWTFSASKCFHSWRIIQRYPCEVSRSSLPFPTCSGAARTHAYSRAAWFARRPANLELGLIKMLICGTNEETNEGVVWLLHFIRNSCVLFPAGGNYITI